MTSLEDVFDLEQASYDQDSSDGEQDAGLFAVNEHSIFVSESVSESSPYPSTSTPPVDKNKDILEDDDGGDDVPKKRGRGGSKKGRARKHNSCEPCRHKKVRCDRTEGCSNCLLRGIDCYYAGNAKPIGPPKHRLVKRESDLTSTEKEELSALRKEIEGLRDLIARLPRLPNWNEYPKTPNDYIPMYYFPQPPVVSENMAPGYDSMSTYPLEYPGYFPQYNKDMNYPSFSSFSSFSQFPHLMQPPRFLPAITQDTSMTRPMSDIVIDNPSISVGFHQEA